MIISSMENNNNYPKYKDSGIEWIGEIPEHWDLKPLKHSVSINRDVLPEATVQDYELQYIDIGNVDINGLMNPPNKMLFKDSPSRARRITRNGDTIVSTVRTYLKAIAFIISDENNLISSTGFAVLTPNGLLHPKYIYYVVSSQKVIDTISSLSVGVSYPAITSSELGCIPIWFPREVSEQQAIADYLDKKAALIDELIEKKRRQIDLLTEQRQAVINQAVTKGLDPDVEMKDSGIEWLGEIPKHWEVKKGKYLFNIISGYAKQDLTQFRLQISLPKVVIGSNHSIKQPGNVPILSVPFTCPLGEFAMEISLNSN